MDRGKEGRADRDREAARRGGDPAPEFKGHEGIWSPEDLYVASVNACIMTTFLAYAARAGLSFEEYESEAEEILHKAERECLVSNSIRAEVVLEPTIV